MVTRSLAAISVTFVDCGSLPSATTAIAMSRSVITRTRRSPSVIGAIPVSSSRISRAASATLESAVTVRGSEVITSLICLIAPPLRLLVIGFVPVGDSMQTTVRRLTVGDEDVVRHLADTKPQTALLADERTIFVAAFAGEEPVGFA